MLFALSLMSEPEFASAALPLFDDDLIDAVEWSFDTCWSRDALPSWLDSILTDYERVDRLTGHGVSFSLLSGEWTPRHAAWIERLRIETALRRYRRISEHVGFAGGGEFGFAAPLPAPHCRSVVALGVARLRLLREAAGCPIGLENLATSLGRADADRQGALLADLVEPVDGFVVLDLHNLWAQCTNFDLDPVAMASTYPLDRVQEFHVSGGSWDERPTRLVRRDTHDADVPDAVLELVAAVAPMCPNLDTVVYERLGTSLLDSDAHAPFRADVRKVRETVSRL